MWSSFEFQVSHIEILGYPALYVNKYVVSLLKVDLRFMT